MTFGEKMKRLRNEKGLSQQELGKKLGIKQQTVAQYEKVPYTPKYDTVRRIAEALNCPINALVESETMFQRDDVADSLIYGGIISRVSDNMTKLTFEAMNKVEEYTKDLLEAPKYRKEPDGSDTPK